MICQGDELFRVKGHRSTPTLPAGPQAGTRARMPKSPGNSTWLIIGYHSNLCHFELARGFAPRVITRPCGSGSCSSAGCRRGAAAS
jgi:hypothetical protein